MVTEEFKLAVITSQYKAYQIAHMAKIHPSTLSKIICGIEKIKKNDLRVIAVGRVLGLNPDDCFK